MGEAARRGDRRRTANLLPFELRAGVLGGWQFSVALQRAGPVEIRGGSLSAAGFVGDQRPSIRIGRRLLVFGTLSQWRQWPAFDGDCAGDRVTADTPSSESIPDSRDGALEVGFVDCEVIVSGKGFDGAHHHAHRGPVMDERT